MEESLVTHSVIQYKREGNSIDWSSRRSFLLANTTKKSKVNYISKVANSNLLLNIPKAIDEISVASSIIIESLLLR